MQIDPRLNEIDDCLYRVATKAFVMDGDKVLLVKEIPEMWWGIPGGGVDHGETVEACLVRELTEELGVTADALSTDFKLVYYTIGTIVNGIPRMNLFYKVSMPASSLKPTDEIAEFGWFTHEEFIKVHMSPSYKDRAKLAEAIFANS